MAACMTMTVPAAAGDALPGHPLSWGSTRALPRRRFLPGQLQRVSVLNAQLLGGLAHSEAATEVMGWQEKHLTLIFRQPGPNVELKLVQGTHL